MTGHLNIDFHKFVDKQLADKGFTIRLADENFVKERLNELVKFINDIVKEYYDAYKWTPVGEQFFLNPMVDKWKYSYAILNSENKVCFLDFVSVYKDVLHQHIVFGDKQTRGMNFGKLILIKICQTGIDNGFKQIETWVHKKNNGSLMFHMKMGWEIETIRDDLEILMKVDLQKARDLSYNLLH